MRDAQKPDHVSLNTLVGRLREGRFVIPDFQREFEWKPWDINDLMRSIFSDYYIGSLLLLKGKPENFKALSCEPIYGWNGKASEEYIVLDGQQRLTAMYYAFFAPDLPVPTRNNRYYYFIRVDRFMAEEPDDAFIYDWTRLSRSLIDIPVGQYAQHYFPLSIFGKEGWALPTWAQGYEKFWKDKFDEATNKNDEMSAKQAALNVENAQKFGDHLRGIAEQYQISYIELDQQLGIEKVCDIFTKLNNTGIKLDTFDLINALLKPKGLQLKSMWREASEKLTFVDTDKMNTYILQVMSLLLQSYCSPKYLYFLLPGHEKKVRSSDGTLRKEVLIATTSEFKQKWDEAVDAISYSIEILRDPHEYGVILSRYLPYVSILPVFSALLWYIRNGVDANRQLDAGRKLSHWYWASVFLSRYSGSVESTSARDFQDVREWFNGENSEPALIKEFETRFRSLDLRKEQKRGTSIYNGIFNLFVIKGSKDWMTGNVPLPGELDDHHIIPAAKAEELGEGVPIHSILNRSPLTAQTNRNVIKDRWPNEYLPELIEQNGRDRVLAILASHFISEAALEILLRIPFTKEDFDLFLSERNRRLLEAIESLLIKERLDLTPQLRELDERVEAVELALRSSIALALNDDISKLPAHIGQKINERLHSAMKKNPAVEQEDFNKLVRKLEYADLRDLQDTISNGALWPTFSNRFGTKELLNTRFNQIGELRNGIRHSRAVTEVARKEGEAAILWFEEILSKK
jgi:hypothetical protein